jgi:hypothetical protein
VPSALYSASPPSRTVVYVGAGFAIDGFGSAALPTPPLKPEY